MRASSGAGRPRLVEQRRQGENPREEILDAAGELFTTQGYSGTTTRQIAEAVGMRQASLYHHFKTKEEIVATLLESTLVPVLEFAESLGTAHDGAEERRQLLDLVRVDVDQLAASKWNLGALYLLPELRNERFDDLHATRARLAREYARRAGRVLGNDRDPRVHLPFRLVEGVIGMRSDGEVGRTPASRHKLIDAIVDAVDRLLS